MPESEPFIPVFKIVVCVVTVIAVLLTYWFNRDLPSVIRHHFADYRSSLKPIRIAAYISDLMIILIVSAVFFLVSRYV